MSCLLFQAALADVRSKRDPLRFSSPRLPEPAPMPVGGPTNLDVLAIVFACANLHHSIWFGSSARDLPSALLNSSRLYGLFSLAVTVGPFLMLPIRAASGLLDFACGQIDNLRVRIFEATMFLQNMWIPWTRTAGFTDRLNGT